MQRFCLDAGNDAGVLAPVRGIGQRSGIYQYLRGNKHESGATAIVENYLPTAGVKWISPIFMRLFEILITIYTIITRRVIVTPLHTLWLPIVLSSVAVFIVSSFIHTVLPWHKSDYPKVPDEDKVRDALRPLAIPPGEYMLPRAMGAKELNSPEFKKKIDEGPVVMLTVRANKPIPMGPRLVSWFVYSIVIGVFVAYVTGRAVPHGAMYLHVFRFAGATAFIAYVVALWELPIWYWRSMSLTIKATVDGLIYALVTAGVFGWLWPR